ncbi:ThuA domain-containing protein [Streptomyces sp. NPDC059818]|uniref:ThuA domain-containing protein n=1 Tax=Streptomyces sp. NPDC059818 TaxID=3346962 RepID=UPI00365247C2
MAAARPLHDPGARRGRRRTLAEFRENPRGRVRVLASADASSYEGGTGDDHSLVWTREHGGARVFCTALGHAPQAYTDPDFRTHLLGGLRHVMRRTPPRHSRDPELP